MEVSGIPIPLKIEMTKDESVLQFNNASPLYEQLKQSILHEIVVAENYKYGERLPSEAELAEKYGVSRITVRRTISELAGEGYLSSQQGRGTFVKYRHEAQELRDFSNLMDTGTVIFIERKIISKERIPANEELAKALDIPVGTPLIKLYRLLSESGRRYSLDTAYFIEDLYPGIYDLLGDDVPTLELVKNHFKIKFFKAFKILGVIQAGPEEAALLECVPGEPLFSITKVYYDQFDKPVHYSYYLMLGRRVKYTLTVTNDEADTKMFLQDE